MASIPQRNGKHSTKTLDAIDAPLFESMQDNLCVGVIRLPAVSCATLKLWPDLGMVVDLAVKGDPKGLVLVAHGLRGSDRKINNRKAAMPQTHSGIGRDPGTGAIRSAMADRVEHARKIFLAHSEGSLSESERTDYAAHRESQVPFWIRFNSSENTVACFMGFGNNNRKARARAM